MEILYRGEIPIDPLLILHEGEYYKCKTRIRFQQGEARYDAGKYGREPYLEYECPVCKGPITVEL